MSTRSNRIENLHPTQDNSEGRVGEHVVNGLYKGADKLTEAEKSMFRLIQDNQERIAQMTSQICDHFCNVLNKVPGDMGDHFVANLDVYSNNPSEIVWNTFAERYNNKGDMSPMAPIAIRS